MFQKDQDLEGDRGACFQKVHGLSDIRILWNDKENFSLKGIMNLRYQDLEDVRVACFFKEVHRLHENRILGDDIGK